MAQTPRTLHIGRDCPAGVDPWHALDAVAALCRPHDRITLHDGVVKEWQGHRAGAVVKTEPSPNKLIVSLNDASAVVASGKLATDWRVDPAGVYWEAHVEASTNRMLFLRNNVIVSTANQPDRVWDWACVGNSLIRMSVPSRERVTNHRRLTRLRFDANGNPESTQTTEYDDRIDAVVFDDAHYYVRVARDDGKSHWHRDGLQEVHAGRERGRPSSLGFIEERERDGLIQLRFYDHILFSGACSRWEPHRLGAIVQVREHIFLVMATGLRKEGHLDEPAL